MRLFVVFLVAVAGVMVAAAPSVASSVEFEYLLADQVALQELNCNPDGTSTATFSAAGIAGGPHPGTFEATISVSAGSQQFGSGELLEVNETFRIVSDGTVITGTKHLIPSENTFYPFECDVVQSAECEEVSAFGDASGNALRYEATIAGPEGTQHEEGYAELHINAGGLMCGGVMQSSWGWMEQFFAAALPTQQPAAVTLTPATAINPVDTFHELTATVVDANGEPVSGAIVRFRVAGASNRSGVCTSDGNGECTFSYQVAPFPGEDTITAYVDLDADDVQDAAEPVAMATKTVALPASTAGSATGGGQFAKNQSAGGDVTFTLTARSNGSSLNGECTIVDKLTQTTIKCLDVLAYVQHGNHATIFGHADQNGVSTLYRISVVDNGERGVTDLFTITTAAGYVASGPVTTGNIQIR